MTTDPPRARWWIYVVALPFAIAPITVFISHGPTNSVLQSLVGACMLLGLSAGFRSPWPGAVLACLFMYTFAAALLNGLLGVRDRFSRVILVMFVVIAALIGLTAIAFRNWNPD